MPEDKYIKFKVKTFVSVVSSLLLSIISICLFKFIYDVEIENYSGLHLLTELAVVVSTTFIIVSVHWVLFCLKDGWKWLKPFTSKRGVFWISAIISAVFCIVKIEDIISRIDDLAIVLPYVVPVIGYTIIRNIVIVIIALLAYKMIMKICNKPQKAALETN